MDIEKAKKACALSRNVDWCRSLMRDLDNAYSVDDDGKVHGTINITIPKKWIPALMQIAEGEVSSLEKQILDL